jgi:CubicO group peptidase (beta-lactamase class C family)
MKKSTLQIFIGLLTLFLGASPVNLKANPKDTKTLEAKVDAIFAQWNSANSPGIGLGVIQDGKFIYKRGYGMADLEQGVAITPETTFYICSTSKQFTAMSIALLEEQGKLLLDDDIRKYLPEMPQYERPVNVRHLVHHTSGIRDYLTLWNLAGRDFADSISEEEAIALIARQKALNFAPGEQYLYSNSGYFLLSVIVKRASGKSLRDFADENIFRPLGMTNTHFHDDRTQVIRKRAAGHNPREGGGFSIVKTSFALVGDGGLYTTVEDLFKWDQNFYNNKLGKGGQALIDRVLTKGKLNDGKENTYAFGLGVENFKGLKVVAHGGAFIGFRTELIRFPEQKFSVIVLSNLGNVDASGLARKVAEVYLADQLKPTTQTNHPASQNSQNTEITKLSADDAKAYVGTYYSEELDTTYIISADGERVLLKARYNRANPIIPVSRDKFNAFGTTVLFTRDEQGKVSGFALDAGRVRNLKFVKKNL